jgi:hypothetical protein
MIGNRQEFSRAGGRNFANPGTAKAIINRNASQQIHSTALIASSHLRFRGGRGGETRSATVPGCSTVASD